MNVKKNILIFTDWYLPAYKAGGPVRSLAALCFHLKNDLNFFIITSNKDAFSTEALPVKSDQWLVLSNGENVYYIGDEKITTALLEKIITPIDFDYVYLNSFFSKQFSIYPLLLRKRGKLNKPFVLAPRGMLGEGALSLKSKKKNLFIGLSKLSGLHKNVTWHATSQQEAEEIKKVFGKGAKIMQVPNLILPPKKKRASYSKDPGNLKICFVSRISKKKNLLFALEILKEIKEGHVHFDIYGPAEDAVYYEQCIAFSKTLPASVSVSFKGDLDPVSVAETMQLYHAFLLPTLNENFGHAIVEAMLNGCIPIISDQTPWKNLYEKGIGWDIALSDKNGFTSAIRELMGMNNAAFTSQSINIQEFMYINSSDPAILEAYRQLFK